MRYKDAFKLSKSLFFFVLFYFLLLGITFAFFAAHRYDEIRLVTIFGTISINPYSTNDWNHDWIQIGVVEYGSLK